MSAITCSLSGSPLIEGVVSLKTGHIFEKSTIHRHIKAYGTCPHTRQSLAIQDLLPLARNNNQTVILNAQYTDSQKIISKIQTEYEALILQAHFLKNALRDSRQELAHSLYRQDASIRVIAKLQQQVQANKQKISKLIHQVKFKDMQ